MTAEVGSDLLVLRIAIGGDSPEAHRAEQERLSLVRELRSVATYSIELAPQEVAPTDAKGAVEGGHLLLTLAASGGVLTSLIAAVQSYLTGRSGRKVILEIDGDKLEVSGMDAATEKKLISSWITRHRR